MLLEDILESDLFCVYQNIAVPFLIYSAVLPYPAGRGNILEIFYVSVLDNLKMWFALNQSYCLNNCFPSKLMEPNKTDS